MDQEKNTPDVGRVLELATEAGHILLENGAEIFRVEETMKRISSALGVEHDDFFVLSNGIFTTGGDPAHRNRGVFAKVQHIPVKGTQLNRVVAVNQLSREIAAGKYTLEEIEEKLREIRTMTGMPPWAQVLASGIGSGSFCFLLGGTLLDSLAAFLVGLFLWVYLLKLGKSLSKIMCNLCGGALVTLLCIAFLHFRLGSNLDHMIVGTIMPLVPGVPFTNGVRDIANSDYIAGAVRLLDAMLIFLSIAIGVGAVISLYVRLGGAFV